MRWLLLVLVLGCQAPLSPNPTFEVMGAIGSENLTAGSRTRTRQVTTDSVSAVPGTLLLLWVSNTSGRDAPIPSLTSSVAWDTVVSVIIGGPRRMTLFQTVAHDSAFAVGIAIPAPGNIIWAVNAHPGADSIVQVATAVSPTFQSGGLVELDLPGSLTLGGFFCGCSGSPVPGQGFTALSANGVGVSTTGSFWMFTEYQDGFDPLVDASWPGVAHWLGIALALD